MAVGLDRMAGLASLFLQIAWVGFLAVSQAWVQPAWRPDKQVELVLPTAPGGGNDTSARLMQKILQEQKLVPTPVLVMNKSGGNQKARMAGHNVAAPPLRGRELVQYFEAQYAQTRSVLVDLGLAK